MLRPRERSGPRRRWGQNFLVNTGAAAGIVAAFRPEPEDRVLEVGPGRGALTRLLLGRVGRLTAIEIDPDLVAALQEQLAPMAPSGELRIVLGNILRLDLGDLLAGLGASSRRPARVIANLPYNIATAVILRFLLEDMKVSDLLVMVQREVAERILARPGRRSYGGLSVLCQTYSRIEPIKRLRPGSFRPRPKVESEVIHLTLRDPGGLASRDRQALSGLLLAAFRHRRKTLVNNLSRLPRVRGAPGETLGAAGATDLILRAGIDPSCRAETVPVEGYLRLLEEWRDTPGPNTPSCGEI